MGFTRYYRRTKEPYDDSFIDYVRYVIEHCKTIGINICGADGTGEPDISSDMILLNGDLNNGNGELSHDTFLIPNKESMLGERHFCKTARKPYDYAVKTILDEAQARGYVTDVSSDGGCLFSTDDSFYVPKAPKVAMGDVRAYRLVERHGNDVRFNMVVTSKYKTQEALQERIAEVRQELGDDCTIENIFAKIEDTNVVDYGVIDI